MINWIESFLRRTLSKFFYYDILPTYSVTISVNLIEICSFLTYIQFNVGDKIIVEVNGKSVVYEVVQRYMYYSPDREKLKISSQRLIFLECKRSNDTITNSTFYNLFPHVNDN